MTSPAPQPDRAMPEPDAHDLAMKIIGLSGLHLCPAVKAETGKVMFCGCAPGKCQQREIDDAA